MTSKLDRRALLRLGGAAAATGLAASRVVAQETPAGPTTPMPPVAAYAIPSVDNIALSPDGTRGALITPKGDDKLLVHFQVADVAPRVIPIGPAKIRGMFFGDNSHIVLTNSSTLFLPGLTGRKHELEQARVVGLDDNKVRLLFATQQGYHPIIMGGLHRIRTDGEYRVTAANMFQKDEFNVCLYSFSLGSTRAAKIHEGTLYTRQWVVTPDGFVQAYANVSDDDKVWSLFYNFGKPGNSSFRMIYNVSDALGYPSLMGLGRDGKSVVIHVRTADDAGNVHEISADGVLSEPLHTAGGGRDYEVLFHPSTGRMAGFKHYDDWYSYDYDDPLLKKLAQGLVSAMGEDYRVAISDFAEDPRKMIIYGESAHDAGSYYFADFSTGEVQFLSSNYPAVPEEWITQKTAISYKAADGLEIHGYLTLPPFRTAKNLPLVVVPHGGPQARDHISYDWQAQVLASRGYAVLQPNFRGSEGYGLGFVAKGHGEWGRKMQTDLSDGVRWLAAQGMVDPNRVAIMGASYGGYAAMAGATLDGGVYRCAVAVAGISDLKSFVDFVATRDDSSKSRGVLYWQRFMGPATGYDALSPARQAQKAACPLLLMHGTDDTVVPIDQSQRMERAMKAAGKPVEFISYPGQDHWETVGSHRVAMMETALAFLQKHNPA